MDRQQHQQPEQQAGARLRPNALNQPHGRAVVVQADRMQRENFVNNNEQVVPADELAQNLVDENKAKVEERKKAKKEKEEDLKKIADLESALAKIEKEREEEKKKMDMIEKEREEEKKKITELETALAELRTQLASKNRK